MAKNNKDTVRLPIQPPLLMLIFLIVAFAFGWKLPIPIPFPAWMQLVGWAIILGGMGLGFSAVAALKKAGTSPNAQQPTSEIVTDGPYRISRNPIYLAYIAIMIGLPLIVGTYWGIALSPMLLDAYNRLVIDREETYLKGKFGEKYAAYCSKTRRWL